jgi:hypothetical protein
MSDIPLINLEKYSYGMVAILLKKYCLVAWKIVYRSKKQGDLDLLDLEMMNTAHLTKWQIRFQDSKVTGKWKDIF